jgi:hypothetical protein
MKIPQEKLGCLVVEPAMGMYDRERGDIGASSFVASGASEQSPVGDAMVPHAPYTTSISGETIEGNEDIEVAPSVATSASPQKATRRFSPRVVFDFGWPEASETNVLSKNTDEKSMRSRKRGNRRTTTRAEKDGRAHGAQGTVSDPEHEETDRNRQLSPQSSSVFSHATTEYLRNTFGCTQSKRIENLLVKYLVL